jgi:YfiH family protein
MKDTLPGNSGFRWQEAPWGSVLDCEPLLTVASHAFTTRQLDLGTNDADLKRGYEALSELLRLSPDDLRDARQVHGTDVHLASRTADSNETPRADILMTADPHLGVVVRTADCVPILMADRRTGAVAAVHAGWRGTVAAVAHHAVHAMNVNFGSRARDLMAALGPSIGVCCYQVGQDVRGAFDDNAVAFGTPHESWFVADGERWRLDLWSANRDQLIAAGIPADAVHVAAECTASSLDRYFSFRAEGTHAGRLLAAIAPRARSAAAPDRFAERPGVRT